MYSSEQQSSFLNLAISLLLEFVQISCTLSAYNQLFSPHVCACRYKKNIINKNKNIFEKMSEYVGFSPHPHTSYIRYFAWLAWFTIVTDHSVYVGSMWVGVRILHIHSFFRKCFYSCTISNKHNCRLKDALIIIPQVNPSPENEGRQEQTKLPHVLLQTALASHVLLSHRFTATWVEKYYL